MTLLIDVLILLAILCILQDATNKPLKQTSISSGHNTPSIPSRVN